MTRPILGRLGPFTGGMNTSSAPSAIGDNELVDCVNFEVDIDGSLKTRPPIVDVTASAPTTGRKVAIGNGTIAGVNYVFFYIAGTGIYAYNGTTWVSVGAPSTIICYTCVQIADLVFFIQATGSPVKGGYWNGTTWTTDANIPDGEAAVLYKQRLWTVPGITATSAATSHQLRFTEPINPTAPTPLTWTATNSIAINAGDGQRLVDLQIYNDNLMLFKQDSTYIYAFDVLPSDGAVRVVSTTLGASFRNCVVSANNSTFLYHEGEVYQISNYVFSKINIRLPLILDTSLPTGATQRLDMVFLSVFGNRIVLRYFNRIYVFSILTGTWSRWTSSTDALQNFGPLVEMPKLVVDGTPNNFYSGSSVDSTGVFMFTDGYNETNTEQIDATILTKTYDFGQSSQFKKLAWWGADVLSANLVTAKATPVAVAKGATWEQLHAYTWAELGTWQIPFTIDLGVVTTYETGIQPQRVFAKFLKSLRFRQINFTLTMETDGTSVLGPLRIYSLSVVVGVKQLVTETTN